MSCLSSLIVSSPWIQYRTSLPLRIERTEKCHGEREVRGVLKPARCCQARRECIYTVKCAAELVGFAVGERKVVGISFGIQRSHRRAYGNFNFPELLPGETREDTESMLAATYRLANYLIGIAAVISRAGQD